MKEKIVNTLIPSIFHCSRRKSEIYVTHEKTKIFLEDEIESFRRKSIIGEFDTQNFIYCMVALRQLCNHEEHPQPREDWKQLLRRES